MSYKGFFKPKNPQKYRGNPTNIVYRSSWECKMMTYVDQHPDVVEWGSEEFSIPYVSPIDGKIHRYFPDFWIKKKDNEILVVEIKPSVQTKPPKPQKRITKRYVTEVRTWGINSAKWKAAKSYCDDRKWKFIIMDEYNLGIVNG
ncbi:MAG: head completion protein [Chitinophagia bacterium]|nr:head completion protein [Chitinophagia bacterium]